LDGSGFPCPEGTIGARFAKRRRVKPGTPGAKKVKSKSKKWYGRLPGKTNPVALSTNKVAAQQMLAALVNKAELGKVGIRDAFEDHRMRPLADHVKEWASDLRAGGASKKHVQQTTACVNRIIEACRFNFIADMSPSRVQQFLADLRTRRPFSASINREQQNFTKKSVAALLSISSAAVGALVKRHRLEASGNGKARRYPRATVEALQAIHCRGVSDRTVRLYLDSIRQFARWLVQDRRTADNPLACLKTRPTGEERRRDRRAFSIGELQKILDAAKDSGISFRGLSGQDRAVLYTTAVSTGFRAGELASLLPEDFQLGEAPPTITLDGTRTKNKRTAVQPIPEPVAALLGEYLGQRHQSQAVWPGTWAEKAADMLRIDLDAAEVPYVLDGPSGPLYGDFHALRHTFVALLETMGASLKQAMQLARHTDPKLTMARYGKLHLEDLTSTINRLPLLISSSPDSECNQMKATGTNAPVCTGFAQTNDINCAGLRLVDGENTNWNSNATDHNTLPSVGFETDCANMGLSEGNSPSRTRTYNKPVNRHSASHVKNQANPRLINTLRRICSFSRAFKKSHFSSGFC
jgi:integrase